METARWSQIVGDGEREAVLEKLSSLHDDDSQVADLLDRDAVEFPVVVVDPCETMKAHGKHFVRSVDVVRYAADMEAGDQFPAPIIDSQGAPGLVVLDGKHRMNAACRNQIRQVKAIDLAGARAVVRRGTLQGFSFSGA